MFIWSDNELNEEQISAIKHEGNVLLTACPGSGKTRTLTYKLAYELSKLNSNKQFVIAITYTHTAADEIKERVELLGIETDQLWIGTIHSFCLEWILKPYHLYIEELKMGFRIINSYQSQDLLTEICNNYNGITYWDCSYYATPKNYVLALNENDPKFDRVTEIIEKYHSILEDGNQIDFEQILFYSLQLLKVNEVVASTLSKIFHLIAIDEYQDTKEIQYHILAEITKVTNSLKLLIVGDANQSIYGSLGGFPMDLGEIRTLFNCDMTELQLSKNYRSSRRIVNYFEYFKTFQNEIVAEGEFRDYDSLISLNRTVQRGNLENELVRLLKYNIDNLGISPNEICIVAPQWVHLASMTRSLITRLPDLSFNGPGMAPFSRDIDNFWFKLSRIVLTEPSPTLYIRRLRWSKEVLNDLASCGLEFVNLNNKDFLKICNSIQIDEPNGLMYLEKFFDEICVSLGFRIKDYDMLSEHHDSFFASSTQRIERLTREGGEFVATIENFRKVFKQREGITISTIHGVKGEEYDVVIGYALLEGYVPHFMDGDGQANAKKMLYVIGSRARKNLHLIAEQGRPRGRRGDVYKITEVLSNYRFEYRNL